MLAERHGITGHVREQLGEVAAPALLVPLRDSEHRSVLPMLRDLGAIRTVAAALDGDGIRWALVKGWTVVERLYGGRPQLRPSGDVDVVVSARQLPAALNALEERGARARVRNWSLLGELGWGQVAMRMPCGAALDLHWDLVNRPDLRRVLRVDTEEVLERAVPLALQGASVTALPAVDGAAHLLVHHATSGGHRLIWVLDALRALELTPWEGKDGVHERVRRWRAEVLVAGFLRRVKRLSVMTGGAPVPPVAWHAWSELVGVTLTRGARLSEDEPLVARELARSARTGLGDSSRAVASTAADALVRRLERRGFASPHRSRRVEALLEPVDEVAGRRAFLADVRRRARRG